MTQFEIKVTNGVNIPEAITTNIGELDALISEKEELARSLVVTNDAEQVAAADADAAEIAKLEKELARFRIDFMRKWKTPVEAFERICKTYEKRLNAAAAQLRTKTGEIKTAQANAKRDRLRERFNAAVAEAIPEWAKESQHFAQFFAYWTAQTTVGSWLNKTATEETVGRAINAEITRVKQCIETIEANYAEDTDETKAKARMVMVESFDVSATLSRVQAWKEEQKRIAKAKAEAEEARRVAAEEAAARAKAEAEAKERNAATAQPQQAQPKPTPAITPSPVVTNEQPTRYRRTLRVSGTADQLRGLIVYLTNQGIGFEKIGKPETI